jgi:hypothetical protein
MTSLTYLGNCSNLINWDKIISGLENKSPDFIGPPNSKPELDPIQRLWDTAGYKGKSNGGTVEWQMYYAGNSFDRELVDKVIEFANIPHYTFAWISKIMPGYCAAPHYDQMESDKKIYRVHVHIEDAEMGHVFYVGNEYITNYKKGDTYIWNNPHAWHGGMNCGFKPKYMLNIY